MPPGIYEQWSQAMMSQAYTHHWDEIEYFDLAVAHAAAKPELKDAVDGCNGCHTPLAFMGGRCLRPGHLRKQWPMNQYHAKSAILFSQPRQILHLISVILLNPERPNMPDEILELNRRPIR